MTTITLPRAVVEQALEALWRGVKLLNYRGGTVECLPLHDAITALRAALAQQAEPSECSNTFGCRCPKHFVAQQAEPVQEPVLQTCNCRWDGEVQVQQCTLHEAHVDAIHEWAERAKVAERKLTQQAEPVEPVAWEGWWLHHGQHNYRAKPLSPERVKELMKLAFEVGRESAPPQQAEPVQEPYTDDVTRIMREAGMTFHLGLPHKAVVEQMTRVVDLVYAEASIKAAQQFAAALAQHPDTDCHTQGICQRSGYGIGKQTEPVEPVAWMHNILEDNIIRHRPADLKRSPQNWTPLCNCVQPRQSDPQIADRLARHGIPKP